MSTKRDVTGTNFTTPLTVPVSPLLHSVCASNLTEGLLQVVHKFLTRLCVNNFMLQWSIWQTAFSFSYAVVCFSLVSHKISSHDNIGNITFDRGQITVPIVVMWFCFCEFCKNKRSTSVLFLSKKPFSFLEGSFPVCNKSPIRSYRATVHLGDKLDLCLLESWSQSVDLKCCYSHREEPKLMCPMSLLPHVELPHFSIKTYALVTRVCLPPLYGT